MAFENITLFEFDLQDAQFGPRDLDVPDRVKGKVRSSDDEVAADVETDTEEDSGGVGIGRMIVMALVVSIAATLIARRLRGGKEETEATTIEFEAEADAAEASA